MEERELTVGEITLLPDRAVVVFKKAVEERAPEGYASIDVNLMSLDILKVRGGSAEYRRIDLRKLYGVRVHYFKRRRRIQSLSKHRPIASKRLMRKYSKRERRRVNDLLHKLTASIASELAQEGLAPILENLKGLSYNAARNKYAKWKNRKVSSLPYRRLQNFIEYKMAWLSYRTYYVSARNTSKACPRCGRVSKTNGQVFRCGFISSSRVDRLIWTFSAGAPFGQPRWALLPQGIGRQVQTSDALSFTVGGESPEGSADRGRDESL